MSHAEPDEAPGGFTTLPGVFFNEGPRPTIQFTERMTGWMARAGSGERAEPSRRAYEDAFEEGKQHGCGLDLLVTVSADDIEALLNEPDHPASFAGTARAFGLGSASGNSTEALLVTGGRLELLTVDPAGIHSRRMSYTADLTGADGRAWKLSGFKSIKGGGPRGFNGPGELDTRILRGLWRDLTRLFFTLRPLGDKDTRLLGVLSLSGKDFRRQLLTTRGKGGDGPIERFDTAMRFFAFFGGVLRDTYGGSFARGRYAPPNWARRAPTRSLVPHGTREGQAASANPIARTPVAFESRIDGTPLRLTCYRGGTWHQGAIILAPGFGVRAASYAIETVRPNLAEFLCGAGYEVWLLDHRASPELGATRRPFTLDHVARFDWPAAIDQVRRRADVDQVNVLAHCLSGASFMMAALSPGPDGRGLLDGKVRAAVVSQVATHPITSTINEIKIMAGLGPLLQLLGVEALEVTVDVRRRLLRRTLVEWLLKRYPTKDPCDNPVCRRVRFVFGESYLHANLDRDTHDRVVEMFGDPASDRTAAMSLRALRHVSRMVSAERIVDADGADVYLTAERAQCLDFPLALLGGERNELFPPEGLEATAAWLAAHGKAPTSMCIPGYGHMDCFIGAQAHEHVYPRIMEWLANPH